MRARFVIDPGFVKQKTYNPEKRMESLVIVPISQVAGTSSSSLVGTWRPPCLILSQPTDPAAHPPHHTAEQRAGRAGRTGPGQCYRLYSKECLGEMMPETVPEIQRCNLANVVLYLKVLGVEDVLGFDYFEAPSEEQLGEALLMLHSLGALDERGKVGRWWLGGWMGD